MRQVDTDALRTVAPSLGIGNPATATMPVVFDDDTLQQSYDVSRLIGAPAFYARLFDGVGTAGASQTDRNQTSIRDLLLNQLAPVLQTERLSVDDLDVYVLGANAYVTEATEANVGALGWSAGVVLATEATDVGTSIPITLFHWAPTVRFPQPVANAPALLLDSEIRSVPFKANTRAGTNLATAVVSNATGGVAGTIVWELLFCASGYKFFDSPIHQNRAV